MSTTEHKPKTPSTRTGVFASLGRLLHAQGSGAPSIAAPSQSRSAPTSSCRASGGLRQRTPFAFVPRQPLALTAILAVAALFALTAAPAFAKEVYLQGLNGEHPTFGTAGAPYGIAVDQANGTIYVVLAGGSIEKLNEAGEPENFSSLGESGFSPGGEFQTVAVDNSTEASDPSKGDFYLANGEKGEIEKYNEAGELLESILAPPNPHGMAVDAHGNLYVTSLTEEGKVFGFSPSGTPLNSGNPVLVVPGENVNPYGLAFNSHGDLYVSQNDYNKSAERTEGITSEFEPEGGSFNATPIEKELSASDRESYSFGVAVNQQTNNVLVADFIPEAESEAELYGVIKRYNEHGEEIEALRKETSFQINEGIAVNETHSTVYAPSLFSGSVDVFHRYKKGAIKLEVSGFGGVTAAPKGLTAGRYTDRIL